MLSRMAPIGLILFTTIAQAVPVDLAQVWQQTNRIEMLSVKDHQIANSDQQAAALRQQKYTCRKVDIRHHCEKWIQIGNTVPQNVIKALLDNTPKKIQLNPTQFRYELIHESEAYFEWQKRQTSLVDNEKFTSTHWREIKGSYARIILRGDQNTTPSEFLILNNNDLARFITIRSSGNNSWKTYNALVLYR